MIKAHILKDAGVAYGFEIKNHGDPIVCSAVSMLATNLVNSLDALTDEPFTFDCDEKKLGYMKLILSERKAGNVNHDADLLLQSFLLGLQAIEDSYGEHLRID